MSILIKVNTYYSKNRLQSGFLLKHIDIWAKMEYNEKFFTIENCESKLKKCLFFEPAFAENPVPHPGKPETFTEGKGNAMFKKCSIVLVALALIGCGPDMEKYLNQDVCDEQGNCVGLRKRAGDFCTLPPECGSNICTHGKCQAGNPPAGSDCVVNASLCGVGTHCDVSTRRCVANTTNTDCTTNPALCASGTVCNPTSKACEAVAVTCTPACTAEQNCVLRNGSAVCEAKAVTDCTANPTVCATGTHCDLASKACVADTVTPVCTPACTMEQNCVFMNGVPVCEANPSCNVSADCPAATPHCEMGSCWKMNIPAGDTCSFSFQCATLSCSPSTRRCVVALGQTCTDSTQCDSGKCSRKYLYCVGSLDRDQACTSDYTCRSGKCLNQKCAPDPFRMWTPSGQVSFFPCGTNVPMARPSVTSNGQWVWSDPALNECAAVVPGSVNPPADCKTESEWTNGEVACKRVVESGGSMGYWNYMRYTQ